MTNTKISQIAKKIPLGENKFKEGQYLDEAIQAGEVVMMTSSGISLNTYESGVTDTVNYLGVMKEHEEFDLDTDITAGKYGDVVTEGYCAARILDPEKTLYPGHVLVGDPVTPGQFRIPSLGSGPNPLATLMRKMVSGDTVGIVKLMR